MRCEALCQLLRIPRRLAVSDCEDADVCVEQADAGKAHGVRRLGTPGEVTDLETALLGEVEQLLGDWRTKYAERPDLERQQLWLLALEREQIVAVAYREEAVAGRLEALEVDEEVRALI